MRHRHRAAEQGFALIGAIWLLVLGSAIVALLMLRAQTSAVAVKSDAALLIQRAAVESAVHTIAAELLLLGPNSRWSRLPASGDIDVDGTSVHVALSSEEGRIDLNAVDLTRLDGVLRQLGLDDASRRAIAAGLTRRRESKNAFTNLSEVQAVLGSATTAKGCLIDAFTVSSGLAEPKADQASAILQAMTPSGNDPSATPQPLGTPLRFVVKAAGVGLTAIVRVSPSPAHPLLISDWRWKSYCGG